MRARRLAQDSSPLRRFFFLTTGLRVYDGKSVTDANTDAGQPMVITGTVAATRIEP